MLVWPRAVGPECASRGPLALKSGLMDDLLTGRVRVPQTVAPAAPSANGAA